MNDFFEKFTQYQECEFIYKGHDYFFLMWSREYLDSLTMKRI